MLYVIKLVFEMVNTKSFRILDGHALSTFTKGFKIKQIITKYVNAAIDLENAAIDPYGLYNRFLWRRC